MKTNNTIKYEIKAMLQTASTESGISYLDLLNDTSTIQDIANGFDITTTQAISITNELSKEYTNITIKINDIVRIKKTNKLGRIKKMNGKSQKIKNGIVVNHYVYNKSDLELINIDSLSWNELKNIVNELI